MTYPAYPANMVEANEVSECAAAIEDFFEELTPAETYGLQAGGNTVLLIYGATGATLTISAHRDSIGDPIQQGGVAVEDLVFTLALAHNTYHGAIRTRIPDPYINAMGIALAESLGVVHVALVRRTVEGL